MNHNKHNFKNKYHKLNNNEIEISEIEIIEIEISEIVNEIISDIEYNTGIDIGTLNYANHNTTIYADHHADTCELIECRICFEEETDDNPFINPCRCRGTSKYVHISCLNEWRNENIYRPAYDICMECRYRYKYTNLYPSEANSIINLEFGFVFFAINLMPFCFIYPVAQYNKMTNNSFIKTYTSDDTSIFYYMKLPDGIKDIINYETCYNLLLFNQSLIIFVCYLLYVLKRVYRKKEYFKHLRKSIVNIVLSLFKFIILINTVGLSYSWLTFYTIFAILFPVIEPFIYLLSIKMHNDIIYTLEHLDNQYTIQNYDSDDDNELDIL
jgi:hypothetical protein